MLSSYELLELCNQLPAQSALKTAIRGGEWSEEEAMRALTANETSSLRAILQVVHGGKSGAKPPLVFRSVSEREEREEIDEAIEEARESVFDFADFTSKVVPQQVESDDDEDE
ncbi:superfamily I DNA/RNA helicase [Mycolicibacterium sp. BK634]|uniref:hypothetical protein n=1 Tax=Mycolicibacterium sp. BK634 TaxID=2587099 RepID=UPI00161A9630|nr:hypothetical protein [Mycolicibacterium sp. BK634]MBB3752617.1 superfamily I DNA/RNA helicase [Mycolicibacterium sp. BK634]